MDEFRQGNAEMGPTSIRLKLRILLAKYQVGEKECCRDMASREMDLVGQYGLGESSKRKTQAANPTLSHLRLRRAAGDSFSL